MRSLVYEMKSILPLLILVLYVSACAVRNHEPHKDALTDPPGIILVIGDGMGPQQLALLAAAHQRNSNEGKGLAGLLKGAHFGVHLPFAQDTLVNDSACSATQLGSGCSCSPHQVGISANGKPCTSVLEMAKSRGRRTGVVSDTRLTHATPAAFASHTEDRDNEDEIAKQMVSSNIDLLLSGGLSYFLPNDSITNSSRICPEIKTQSRRHDQLNLIHDAQQHGYDFICTRNQLAQQSKLPVLGLFAASGMADAFNEGLGTEPSLAQMTTKALELLDNPKGFILVVESGQIDWAAHHNDTGWLMAEMRRLDRVLEAINSFVQKNPRTLVLLTADHETGGFGFSYRKADKKDRQEIQEGIDFGSVEIIDNLLSSKRSLQSITHEFRNRPTNEQTAELLVKEVFAGTGLKIEYSDAKDWIACFSKSSTDPKVSNPSCYQNPFYPYPDYAATSTLARLIDPQRNVVWATGTHTSTPILVIAKGPGSERFATMESSTAFAAKILP